MEAKYRATLVIGKDPKTGKAIRKNFYATSRREANRRREEFRYKLEHGMSRCDYATFEQIAEQWLVSKKEGIVSDSTYYGYRVCIDACKDYFGQCAIQSISTNDIDLLIKSKKDMSKSYLDKLKITIRAIFKYAIDNNYIPKNPTANMLDLEGRPPKKKEPYSEYEMRKVLDYAKIHHYGLGIFITLKTGLRCGELMGLKASDFDFENQVLSVRRTAVNNNSSNIIKIGGKTENSVRMIPFDDETKEFLLSRPEFKNDDFIFTSSKSGKPIAPNDYSKRRHYGFMNDMKKEIGVRVLTPHYLRHTYGTHLHRLGNDLFKIMKIMGHSSVETTRKIYIHDTIDDLKRGLKL